MADNGIQKDDIQNRIYSFAFVIAAAACMLLSAFFAVAGFSRSKQNSSEIVLESRVNPNNAPVPSMVRLPGIGVTRADAIVAYRDNFMEQQGRADAFRDCSDLDKVKGIGPKTVQNISEWLKFE